MTRALAGAPMASFTFVIGLMLAWWAVQAGFASDDAVRLWASASGAGEGLVPIGRIVATYPTLPFLATTLIALIAPDGAPAPALMGAGLLGILSGLWFNAFREAGLPALVAVISTVLLVLHPTLLRAAVAGPAEMFLVLSLAWLANGLYSLRARCMTSEVMAVGLALVAVAFSHPMGVAIACAAVPFLVFAVPPMLIASSAFNIVIALVFPTVFAFASFTYVSWVFPGSGWSFFADPTESLAAWSAGMARLFGDGLTGSLAIDAGIAMAIVLVLGAPVAAVALSWVRRRRPLIAPALVFAAAVVAAAIISVASGMFGDPAVAAVAAPILGATVIRRVPLVPQRLAIVVPLLVAGWFGGAISLAIVDPAVAMHARALFTEPGGDRERVDALAAGGATIGRDGVLIDADNAPAFVLGRGRARGLLAPKAAPFVFAILFSRLDSPFVAVPDPQSNFGINDQLNKAFPALYRSGAPGYRLVYENNTWRVFEKIRTATFEKINGPHPAT